MKRLIITVSVFAGAFLSTLLLQRFTFMWQEADGLFLMAGDYFRMMFSEPFPLSGIAGDFLSQFFRYSLYAPFIMGAGTALTFLMAGSVLRRLRLDMDLAAILPACALWLTAAFSAGPKPGTAVFLCTSAVWLLSRLVPRPARGLRLPSGADIALCAACVCACFAVIAFSGKARARETVAKVRYNVSVSDWDAVLATATPEAASENASILAPALLALGEKGLLGERLFSYDVRSEDDFDMVDQGDSYESLFFRSFLYSSLACPLEAVHNLSQLSTLQSHGTSFLVLRQLVLEYFRAGDFGLVEKYCRVLERSTLNKAYVAYFRRQMGEKSPRGRDSVDFRKEVPLITHDPFYNLYLLEGRQASPRAVQDRILCTLLLKGNVEGFRTMLQSSSYASGPLPKHYQEALVMAGYAHEGITPAVRTRYEAFQADMTGLSLSRLKERYAGTFWMYLINSDASGK